MLAKFGVFGVWTNVCQLFGQQNEQIVNLIKLKTLDLIFANGRKSCRSQTMLQNILTK